MFTWGRIVLSLPKRAHVDWNWPISREKYLKMEWSVKMPLQYGSCSLLVMGSWLCYWYGLGSLFISTAVVKIFFSVLHHRVPFSGKFSKISSSPINLWSTYSNALHLQTELNKWHNAATSWSRGPFLENPGNFSARKAILNLSVSKNGEVYTRVTSCMKRTSVRFKNMWKNSSVIMIPTPFETFDKPAPAGTHRYTINWSWEFKNGTRSRDVETHTIKGSRGTQLRDGETHTIKGSRGTQLRDGETHTIKGSRGTQLRDEETHTIKGSRGTHLRNVQMRTIKSSKGTLSWGEETHNKGTNKDTQLKGG